MQTHRKSTQKNKGRAATIAGSWLLATVLVLSLIPNLGFPTRLLCASILLACLLCGILGAAQGRVFSGILIMLASLTLGPLTLFFVPWVSSAPLEENVGRPEATDTASSMLPTTRSSSITITDVDAKAIDERGGDFLDVSWKITVTNPSEKAYTCKVKITFIDGEDFAVGHDAEYDELVRANCETTISSVTMMKRVAWDQVRTFSAHVKID